LGNELLKVENLQVVFNTRRGILKAVNDVSFTLKKGEIAGLVGESGCGKSVTALSIVRLLPPTARIISGQILFKGRNLLELTNEEIRRIRGKEIAMIFQDPETSLDPVFTIDDQVEEAITIHQNVRNSEVKKKVIRLLNSVGISEARKNQYPHQYSKGMKQRAMTAMSLSNAPELIIADEPTTALDVTVQAQVIDLLKSLQKEHDISILLITHDMGLIAEMCDHANIVYAGYVIEAADIYTIFKDPHHPYTRALIKAVPNMNVERKDLEFIPGTLPDPLNLPTYCVFAPRCKYAKEICFKKMPLLKSIDEKSKVACHFAQHLG
jgi:peptide/nickel transport system ATP-binding protein